MFQFQFPDKIRVGVGSRPQLSVPPCRVRVGMSRKWLCNCRTVLLSDDLGGQHTRSSPHILQLEGQPKSRSKAHRLLE